MKHVSLLVLFFKNLRSSWSFCMQKDSHKWLCNQFTHWTAAGIEKQRAPYIKTTTKQAHQHQARSHQKTQI